ncbi:MAG TPA: TlpA disulfide reductase family protein [Candidatus Limnocylindrales bacterium]|nr:TlpA disulfide reductase family protein [Candidatus Limnocylindrales bacterium]
MVGSRSRAVLLVVVAAVVAVGVYALVNRPVADPVQVTVSGGPARVGAPAPDFATQDLDGRVVKLSALANTPRIVNFWATWCTACQDEMPMIQQAVDANRAAGLTVLAADFRETDRPGMRRFLDRLHLKLRAIVDPKGRIADVYGVTVGLPVSVFINRRGTIVAIQLGAMTAEQLAADLRTVLA